MIYNANTYIQVLRVLVFLVQGLSLRSTHSMGIYHVWEHPASLTKQEVRFKSISKDNRKK